MKLPSKTPTGPRVIRKSSSEISPKEIVPPSKVNKAWPKLPGIVVYRRRCIISAAPE
jgi:hypothetical protein